VFSLSLCISCWRDDLWRMSGWDRSLYMQEKVAGVWLGDQVDNDRFSVCSYALQCVAWPCSYAYALDADAGVGGEALLLALVLVVPSSSSRNSKVVSRQFDLIIATLPCFFGIVNNCKLSQRHRVNNNSYVLLRTWESDFVVALMEA
jgi:hypothetical protein